MFDHIHLLVKASSKTDLSAFVRDYTCRFSRLRNVRYRRKGDFFQHRYGSAPKVDDKKARTAIAYLYNNPVEKKLCGKAEEFQWNFLDYSHDSHPFSEPLKLRSARQMMRRAVAEVRALRESDTPLGYDFIDRIIKGLSVREIRQLTDFIVVSYNCIDYQDLSSYYSNFETLLIAVHSNTGSEYQIKEEITQGADTIFIRMASVIKKMTHYKDMREVLALPDLDRRRIAWILSAETGATPRQISKFLQISLS